MKASARFQLRNRKLKQLLLEYSISPQECMGRSFVPRNLQLRGSIFHGRKINIPRLLSEKIYIPSILKIRFRYHLNLLPVEDPHWSLRRPRLGLDRIRARISGYGQSLGGLGCLTPHMFLFIVVGQEKADRDRQCSKRGKCHRNLICGI